MPVCLSTVGRPQAGWQAERRSTPRQLDGYRGTMDPGSAQPQLPRFPA